MSAETISTLMPEIVLVAAAALVYVVGTFSQWRRVRVWIGGGGIALAAVLLAVPAADATAGAPIVGEALAGYVRWAALAVGGLFVIFAARPAKETPAAEYVGSLLLAVVGLMLVGSAGDIVLLFLALELISISTYVLLYLGAGDDEAHEATVKYFFLGLLASVLLLYGLSFLYGVTGQTDLAAIRASMASEQYASAGWGPLANVALVLIVAGLGLKIAAVPFHFWVPDVYGRTSYANAAMLSVIPKAAGMIALVRLAAAVQPGTEAVAWRIFAALSVLTMTLGNLTALRQDNLRRLLAYCSIAHGGYMLIALAVAVAPAGASGDYNATGALLFYLCVYSLAMIGMGAALDYLRRRGRPAEVVEELAGLGRSRPWSAAAIAVLTFSLAGAPPLAGFWGKFVVLAGALSVDVDGTAGVRPWFVALAVVAAVNMAVAAAYYVRIVATMYLRTPLAVPKIHGVRGVWLAAATTAALIVLVGLLPGRLLQVSFDAGLLPEQPKSRSRSGTGVPDLREKPPPRSASACRGGGECVCSRSAVNEILRPTLFFPRLPVIHVGCDSYMSPRRQFVRDFPPSLQKWPDSESPAPSWPKCSTRPPNRYTCWTTN